jgi:ribosomal protein S18 acetylase RimI-like enzyme
MIFYMILRRAFESDIPKLTELGISLLKQHSDFDIDYYDLEYNSYFLFNRWLQDQFKNPSVFLIVAEKEETAEIIGFISGFLKALFPWFKNKTVGHISFMVIDENHRQKKYGRLLEEEAIKWFKSKNISYVELYVDETNNVGKIVWEKYGYTPFKKFLRKRI